MSVFLWLGMTNIYAIGVAPMASALGSVVNAKPESARWSLISSRYVASGPVNSLALNESVQCSLPMCVKLVLDILNCKKFYLDPNKLFFLAPELKLLGHIISHNGVKIDSAKVDTVVNWQVPTNQVLLHAFLGAVGYLADNIADVQVPIGILHTLTGDTVSF